MLLLWIWKWISLLIFKLIEQVGVRVCVVSWGSKRRVGVGAGGAGLGRLEEVAEAHAAQLVGGRLSFRALSDSRLGVLFSRRSPSRRRGYRGVSRRSRLLRIGGERAVERVHRRRRRVHERDAVVERGVDRVFGELALAHVTVEPEDSAPAERERRLDVPPAASHPPEVAPSQTTRQLE